MAMWAGVQNVSRPMERCQEMSHWPPIMAEVTPKTAHQTYQGTRSTAVRTGVETDEIVVVVVAMLSPYTFLIIASCGAGLQSCAGSPEPALRVMQSTRALPASRRAPRSASSWHQMLRTSPCAGRPTLADTHP